MSVKCGIVGLPNVGKSTIFNALSNAGAEIANYPFCTIEPNIGIAKVPDKRVDQLAEIVKPAKITHPVVQFVDIAGLVKGASSGEGLGNQFLSHIREVNAIIHVLRAFSDPDVVHSYGTVDLLRDKEIIDTELMLADLSTVEKQIIKTEKMIKAGNKETKERLLLLNEIKNMIEQSKSLRSANKNLLNLSKELFLLSVKPIIYVINVDDNFIETEDINAIKQSLKEEGAKPVILSGKIESELAEMENDEKQLFFDELGLTEPALDRLIKISYETLDLITFYTAGPKEARGWTIKRGATAKEAAGQIHSDIEKGFIKAQIIKFDDFIRYKSEQVIKEKGLINIVGKDYIMADGDMANFMFK